MSERRYPVARVRLYHPGRRYVQRYDGFGQYDVVADLWRGGGLTCSEVVPASLGITAGVGRQGPVSTGMALDHERLNAVVCRPFLDTSQAIGAEHFDLSGGHWLPLGGLGIGQEVRLYQYDGKAAGPTGAVSRFTLPRNPVVCLSLFRCDPSPGQWAGEPPSTEIHLGVGTEHEVAVVLPYGGAAFVTRREGGQWQRVQSDGRTMRLGKLEGYGPGERLLVWMGVFRGKLVVSTDGFVDDYWICPGGPESLSIPCGKLSVWHNAGQWAFSVLPVKMTTATLDCAPVSMGYDTQACSSPVFVHTRALPVVDAGGTELARATVADHTVQRTDLSDLQRAWRATVTPHRHQCADPAFETWVSPELYSVQIGQQAELVDTGLQAWDDISDDVRHVTGHITNDGRASLFGLGIDNSLGQNAELSEYRKCELGLGWVLGTGEAEYSQVAAGYLVEPDPAVQSGPEPQMEVALIDPMIRLRDEKCDGRAPVFDGWLVRDVFEWVLGRCGVAADQRDLEDTGTRLSSGAFDRPVWQAEPGRSWGEFLQEVAQFDYRAAVYFDAQGTLRKTCRFCRQERTAETVVQHTGDPSSGCGGTVQWELYTRNELAETPDADGAVLSISRPRKSLHSSEFVNYVAVCGLGADGVPVRAVAYEPAALYDPASDRFVGWRKMEVAALETHTSAAEVNRLALEILQDRSQRPEHVAIVIPLEPGMGVGQVIRVNGGERVGASGRTYRIESVRHDVTRDEDSVATTLITARWLREDE